MCFMPSDSCPSSLETQLCRWSLQQQFPGRFWRLHAKRFARQPGCGEHHWVRISAFLGVKLMASASSNPGLELMQKYWNSWISFALLRIQLSFVSWFLCEVEIGAQLGFAEGLVLWIQRRIAWSATLLAPGEKQTLRANSEFGWIWGNTLRVAPIYCRKKMPQDRDIGWPWFYDSIFSRFSPFPPLSLRGERFSVQLPSSVCSTRCSSPGGLSNTVGHPRALESHGFHVDLSHGWFTWEEKHMFIIFYNGYSMSTKAQKNMGRPKSC
jgi:hypothetical protein